MANTINKQTPVTPVLSDLIALWGTVNGRTGSTSLSLLLELFQDNLVFPETQKSNTQYSSPTSDSFSVQVTNGTSLPSNEDTHLILTPSLALDLGTIVFPLNTGLSDKQLITINTTNQLTNLTLDKNGASGLYGNISSMGADDYVTYKYDQILDAWFRVA